ncbi:spore germination protein [Gracilibacillus sp. YIM 98692]|uniref:spore germination protein n=1 Tax=Gracilibacillus sp. YIM 98692 TaxID=2663532 RepID=UPI001969B98E|nr:spore germination protein [Gracilibacillus sp. YIM 98692]
MKIQFDSININKVSSNAGVFVGSNIQLNWSSQTKENSAQGTVIGDMNHLSQNANVVYDNDVVDMPIKNDTNQNSEKDTKNKIPNDQEE